MQRGFTLIELTIVVAVIGILAAIAVPQYQNHIIKSQVIRVMAESGALRASVDLCMLEGKLNIAANECQPLASGSTLMATGSAKDQEGRDLPINTGVPQITNPLKTDHTPNTITAIFGNSAMAMLHTKTVVWSRDTEGSWRCVSTVGARYAPAECPSSAVGSTP